MSAAGSYNSEELDCTECGHGVTLHTDHGCIYRSAGTREHAPRTCTCERTRIELRQKPELMHLRPRISVVVGDITALAVDAIVNAANEQLARGGGVCGAIFRAAGPQLDEACAAIGPCATGEARITPGFNARARWIVHAVGPVWRGGADGEAHLLASAYRNALELAREAGAHSIALPAISTGIYGYPREQAAQIAIHTIQEWCKTQSLPRQIVFCCFTSEDATIYRRNL
ncbi:MAG TPA: macro domain-containing protein [Candidatus Baltobacteraceae bacterium]|nr:macro domain-containing protein [Candidatus Baltobacteraceae bacterium]